MDGIVFGVDYPEEFRVTEIQGASAAEKTLAIHENADIVAAADIELFRLVAVGVDAGTRKHKRRALEDFRSSDGSAASCPALHGQFDTQCKKDSPARPIQPYEHTLP